MAYWTFNIFNPCVVCFSDHSGGSQQGNLSWQSSMDLPPPPPHRDISISQQGVSGHHAGFDGASKQQHSDDVEIMSSDSSSSSSSDE